METLAFIKAREADHLLRAMLRGFVRHYRKRGKAGKVSRWVTEAPDVLVVTRPKPRHRAARLSQTH